LLQFAWQLGLSTALSALVGNALAGSSSCMGVFADVLGRTHCHWLSQACSMLAVIHWVQAHGIGLEVAVMRAESY
jgi:hypothetical protein